jgi:1-acyl-sn-glycerol-3-phosphate acyltransferase
MHPDLEYKIVKGMVTALTKACYRIQVTGLENIKNLKAPYIMAGNHHSTIDAIIMGLFVPGKIHFLGKQSALWNNKVWGRINDYFGTIPVQEKGAGNESAIDAGLEVLMRRKKVLGIFPEGAILPKKKSYEGRVGVAKFALKAQVPVVCVGILGTEDVLPYPEYGRPAVWPRVGKKVELHIRPPLYFNYNESDAENYDVLRTVTDQIMKEIRIASKGYGCPVPILKDLMVKGILTRNIIMSKA